MADTRRLVGGTVWAKAGSVTRDAGRIFGAGASEKWLKGIVLEVLSQKKNDNARRSTTYVKALYKVGNAEKTVILSLQSLKAKDPADPATTTQATTTGTEQEPQLPPLTNETTTTAGSSTNTSASDSDSNAASETATQDDAGEEMAAAAPPPRIPGDDQPAAIGNAKSVNHGRSWYDNKPVDVDFNGPVPKRSWKMHCEYSGRDYTPGCDEQTSRKNKPLYTPWDFFMACFPKSQLKFMVEQTNAALTTAGLKPTSFGEVLKYLGVLVLMTRFEFGNRQTLWRTKTSRRYMFAPNFGKAMARHRFEELHRYIVWSFQPPERDPGMSLEQWRWMRVSGWVERFNLHRKENYSPSSLICVDESISRWYGLGGNWINIGLPHYVAIDRKPEDGCEIQNAADGYSGIMMNLKLVTSAENQEQHEQQALEVGDNG